MDSVLLITISALILAIILIIITIFIIKNNQNKKYKKEIENLDYFHNIHVTQAGGVIASHCGPGTLGVLYVAK